MKSHTLFGLGMTALLLGGFAAGGVTLAGAPDTAKQASKAAKQARKALTKGDGRAVPLAEAAVAAAPQNVAYRLLLADSYLKTGRFASAQAAYADVLSLDAGSGKAALNLALTEIAAGKWDAARDTLMRHGATIPARDRGLAWALAGDPAGGVRILMAAAREPDAGARTRQNLALALALAGQWREAKMVARTDLDEAEATRRITQWSAFAQPAHASDQVSWLLGVRPAVDAGMPAALALNAPPPVTPAAEPVAVAAADPAAADTVAAPADPAVQLAAAVPPAQPAPIVFAERREVVQPLPESAPRIVARAPFKTRVALAVPPKAAATGVWYVQLGAFDSAGVARDAWGRATRRYAALGRHTPAGAAFKGQRGSFYRLAVGGFVRTDALALCRGYRAKGGACFVRQAAGDRVASWVKPARVMQAKASPRLLKRTELAAR